MTGWARLAGAGARGAERLRAAWEAPQAAQEALLGRILRDNAASAFGRAHGFGAIDSPQAFRRAVPAAGYDAIAPWIARVAAGETDALTAAAPLCFEETSGSDGARKLIPYTQALLDDFREAALPWLDAALAHLPEPKRGSLYLALSPAARAQRTAVGGLSIGLPDAAYLGPDLGGALSELLAVPAQVAALTDVAAWRRATLTALVERDDLALVSVWSPTFFAALLDALPGEAARLPLSPPARARLDAALAGGALDARALWPSLALLSCWTDGPSQGFARDLAARLPGVAMHAKGLLATEAATTTPLRLAAGVEARAPALLSTYLEFVDAGGAPRGAHELREGELYRVRVTTSGGLYRYETGDAAICRGFAAAHGLRVPDLAFAGRDAVSDLVGEKLSDAFVAGALAHLPAPAALRACATPAGYVLIVESATPPPAEWRASVEAALCENPHYVYARALRQLAPLAVETTARLADLFGAPETRLAMVKPRAVLKGAAAK